MEVGENFVNKVALSGLMSFDPATIYPEGERVLYDIKDNLFHGLMLKERDFREFVKDHAWEIYSGKHVAVTCTTEAIVPTWAYMLLASKIGAFAKTVFFGNLFELETVLFNKEVEKLDIGQFKDQRVVIKGCGDVSVPVSAYVALTARLNPVVKSIMYGEPCSTVPVFKRKD